MRLHPVAFAVTLSITSALSAQSASYATFGPGCAGSQPVSTLTPRSVPLFGRPLQVALDNLPQNVAVMLTGLTNSGTYPLPLAGAGMPNCWLRVSSEMAGPVLGVGGNAIYQLPLPPLPVTMGLHFYQQAVVLDPAAGNAANQVMSDAAEGVIGYGGVPSGAPVANMVLIAPGSFQMGSTAGYSEELPVHTVHITQPFWVGAYEVTQAEYQAVMGRNPSRFQGANRPVEMVTWDDAWNYCAALTALEDAAGNVPAGYQYRLPTEAEWEYCCRAGTTTEWNTGSSPSCAQVNKVFCVNQTVAVGSYAPNAWGLYDTHGNVWEWCLDGWMTNYPSGPVADPYVAVGSWRSLRGGGWFETPFWCRSAKRHRQPQSYWGNHIGFRVVLAPVLAQYP